MRRWLCGHPASLVRAIAHNGWVALTEAGVVCCCPPCLDDLGGKVILDENVTG
jgi:hypothetical protein